MKTSEAACGTGSATAEKAGLRKQQQRCIPNPSVEPRPPARRRIRFKTAF